MKDIQFVNSENLENLEQYAAALLSSMISLRTLESFHIVAFRKGLLDEDESETGKTICWEIKRLMALYKAQIENVLNRTQLSEEQVLESLKSMMPNIKKPVKRKYTKKQKQNE